MVSRAIERAQKQVEGRNFEVRKHLLEYDDVMNKQREAIYTLRRDILQGKEGRDYVLNVADDLVAYSVETHCPERSEPSEWNLDQLATDMLAHFNLDVHAAGLGLDKLGIDQIGPTLQRAVRAKYAEKEERLGGELMRALERDLLLRVVDQSWKDHLLALDHLKEGIGLRGYGQKDPLNEYKRESYELFQAMKDRVEDTSIRSLFRIEPVSEEQLAGERRRRESAPAANLRFSAPPKTAGPERGGSTVRAEPKVGRNDPCPCGSGKKYKKCHGAASA